MDAFLLCVACMLFYHGLYWYVPMIGMVSLTLQWEAKLSGIERWKWKLSAVPNCVLIGCECYKRLRNRVYIIDVMNDNMRDTVCMVYDIFKTNYGITKTSTAGTNNMNELISKLDKMPYDMLKEVSPEQMQMVRENKVIQGLVGQIDSVMQNNQRVMTKLRTMNLDSRIRELLNNLKPC